MAGLDDDVGRALLANVTAFAPKQNASVAGQRLITLAPNTQGMSLAAYSGERIALRLALHALDRRRQHRAFAHALTCLCASLASSLLQRL
jgi:hypothetical protein